MRPVDEREQDVARVRVEREPDVGLARVGLRVGVRVVDRPQVPAALVQLVERPGAAPAVEPVRHRRRVGVRHREDLHRDPVGGRDHPAALVRELAEPLLHDLLHEDAVQLGMDPSRRGGARRTRGAPVAGANATSGPRIPGNRRARACSSPGPAARYCSHGRDPDTARAGAGAAGAAPGQPAALAGRAGRRSRPPAKPRRTGLIVGLVVVAALVVGGSRPPSHRVAATASRRPRRPRRPSRPRDLPHADRRRRGRARRRRPRRDRRRAADLRRAGGCLRGAHAGLRGCETRSRSAPTGRSPSRGSCTSWSGRPRRWTGSRSRRSSTSWRPVARWRSRARSRRGPRAMSRPRAAPWTTRRSGSCASRSTTVDRPALGFQELTTDEQLGLAVAAA